VNSTIPNSSYGVLKSIKWLEPKPASNLSVDKNSSNRAKAAKFLKSEFISLSPKILTGFGLWFTLTGIMQIGKKSLLNTFKEIFMPILIASSALGFDYFLKPKLIDFSEIPAQTPKVDLDNDICWDPDSKKTFEKILNLFMGHSSNYLTEPNSNSSIHGTKRDGLLILAGPPGNGKTAIAYGIGEVAKKPIVSVKLSEVGFGSALEDAFQKAKNKNGILFIDEADAIIGSRSNKITQSFLETFNRFQRESPIRVILATNSFNELDPAIQSRAYVFNLTNPNLDLKIDILKQKLKQARVIKSAYQTLLRDKLPELKALLDQVNISGRDIESLVNDTIVIAEMRINQNSNDASQRVIKYEDFEIAVQEFNKQIQLASKESI
jgi:SpoVK/Ycf46/Vps4 family AAA+-type ATPase